MFHPREQIEGKDHTLFHLGDPNVQMDGWTCITESPCKDMQEYWTGI